MSPNISACVAVINRCCVAIAHQPTYLILPSHYAAYCVVVCRTPITLPNQRAHIMTASDIDIG